MKGRKKDTFLLSFVIMLSVIFVVTSTSIYSSSEKTKLNEKMSKFGTWKSVYISNELKSNEEELLKNNSSISWIKSFNESTLGKLGSLPSQFIPDAKFHLIEGSLPKAMDEVAIEYSQISNFNSGLKIGDIIPVKINTKMASTEESTAYFNSIQYYTNHHINEIFSFAKTYPNHEVAQFINNYETDFFPNMMPRYVDANNDESLADFLSTYNINEKKKMLDETLKMHLIFRFGQTQEYNIFESKIEDNMRIDATNKIKYSFFSPFRMSSSPSNSEAIFNTALTDAQILERAIPFVKEVSITIPLKVTGFIDNYTDNWDGGSHYPKAFVTEETFNKLEKGFFNNSFIDVSNYQLESFIFESNKNTGKELSVIKTKEHIKNTSMYPEIASKSDLTITIGALSLIAIATVAAVFQVNLTQMKRRTRKIVLLKSIGAVRNQIYRLIISEISIIFLLCIPLGTFLGLGISYGILKVMNLAFEMSLTFYLNPLLLSTGLIISIISVILGMSFPVLKAVNVPLTGGFNEPVRIYHAPKAKTHLKASSRTSKLTFKHISIKHLKRERKKNILTYTLYTVAIGAILSTIALSYVAYTPYIDQVIINNAPDFSAELIHGLSKKDTERVKMELEQIDGVSDVLINKFGLNAYMYHPDLFNFAPFTDLPARRSYKKFSNIVESNDYLIKKSRLVNCYAFNTNETAYEKLITAGVEKTLNKEAFEKGEEVILLLPSYQKDQLSYNFKDQTAFKNDYAIQVGDTFDLTIPTEKREGDTYTNDVAFHKLKVGAIVHAFELEGIWPFTKNPELPIIITSYNGLGNLYKGSYSTPRMDYKELVQLIQTLEPTKNGRTSILVYTEGKADMLKVETEISKVLKSFSVKPSRNFIENEMYFNSSLKISMIILILGFSITTISLMILYNTSLSKIESERQRIGILQALGVTHKQFKSLYLVCGILFGILSLTLGSIMALLLLTISTGGFSKIISSNFTIWWLFPWEVCMWIGFIFIVLSTLIYFLPIKKALKSEPIHNISGLQN